MKRWRKVGIIALLSVAVVLTLLACMRHRYPVLIHLFSECVCTDYSEAVTGLTVFNPFRDRAPEESADAFLENLRQGQPLVVTPDFNQVDWATSKRSPLAFEWRLRNRREGPNQVSLYYQYTRFDYKPYERWESEGIIQVVEINGTWKVSYFDVIW